jgi:shikimate kinase
VALIGFMGCGKTSAGRIAAAALGWRFVDIDEYIQLQSGQTIAYIFHRYGEEYFRVQERGALEYACGLRRAIISTGGGAVKSEENAALLRSAALVLYLEASAEHIYANTIGDDTRPLLTEGGRMETIRALLAERAPLYARCAHRVISCGGSTLEHIAGEIVKCAELLANG